MTMSLNTLPHIPLNTTRYSPDHSSISSDSSKPTLTTTSNTYSTSTSEATNIPSYHSQQTDTYQTNIKIVNPSQPQQPQQQQQQSPYTNVTAYNDCDIDPFGFRDSFADASFSSLYGNINVHNRGNLEFDEHTNENTTNPFGTNSNNPFSSDNNINNNINNININNTNKNNNNNNNNTSNDNCFYSPFATATNTANAANATAFRTNYMNNMFQAQQTTLTAPPPYSFIHSNNNNNCNNRNTNNNNNYSCTTMAYNNISNNNISDPSIVSFAPGRPRPGASSQICCITSANNSNCNNTNNINNNRRRFTGIQYQTPSNNPISHSSFSSLPNLCNNRSLTVTVAPPPPTATAIITPATSVPPPAPGEYVYNAAGDIIGYLENATNIVQTNGGQCNVMRPLLLPSIDKDETVHTMHSMNTAIPPPVTLNVINNNRDCNFTVMEIGSAKKKNVMSYDNKEGVKQVKTITRQTMKRGRHISSSEKPFICETCGKGYKYLCNYRSHCKIHTDDAFVCAFCNKRFGRKSNYKEHVRIHTGEAPYKCQFCDRTFKQHHGWKDHLRVHTGEKPYLCKVCGKRFTVGHNLNVHMRIHTGERPYTCDICKKSYRQKSAYNSHIKNVHGIKVRRVKPNREKKVNFQLQPLQ